MKKRIFSALLVLALALSLCPAALAAPAAVSEAEAARTLAVLKVMVGGSDGSLHLDANVTRAELTKMAVACSQWADSVGDAAQVKPYPDVARDAWYAPYIELARDKGLVKGDSSTGRFWPDGKITLAEAVTMILRLLGYQDESFSGAWPTGQMAMYRTLKLDRGINAEQGEPITRRDALYLFYNLLTCKTTQGQVYATVLGYPVADGRVDYLAQAKKDLTGPLVSDGSAPALSFVPRAVYLNDRAVESIAWAADDVYYYNAGAGFLWVYRDTVFGEIGALTPSTADPTAVTVDGKSYPLDGNAVKETLSALGDDPAGSLVTLLLGMDGKAVAAYPVSGPFVAGEGEELDFTPHTVKLNDRTVASVTLEADDVYYYNADQGNLWVYRDTVFGEIGAVTPTAADPTAVTVGGKSYPLATDAVKEKLSALGDDPAGSLVTLLLGMDGKAVAAHTVNGPFVAREAETALPFTPRQTYRNGKLSDAAAPGLYDVYYYDEDAETVWIYTDRVSGKIDALSPSALAPTAVTVDGKSYSFRNSALSRRLSALNGQWTGEYVTLLFGMDGGVVEVLTGKTVEADYYGVVQRVSKAAEDGAVQGSATVFCTDGAKRTFPAGETEFKEGDLVHARLTAEGVTLERVKGETLSGKVNKAATKVGDLAFAEDIEVLDTEGSDAAAVEVSRLAGLTLSRDNVRFYTRNAAGEVDRLILKDAAGALWDYVYLTAVTEQSAGGMNFTVRYTYLLDGRTAAAASSNKSWPVQAESGAALRLGADGSVRGVRSLKEASITSLSGSSAYASNRSFTLAEDAQAWLKDGEDYYSVAVEDLTAGEYTLTGWYDDLFNQVRVILAVKK